MKKRVLYGTANYEDIVKKNGYFVDKTVYIEKLEDIENPVFLRPRRFGKSLLCRMLECYYDINQRDDFERLFGHTYIGQHPTPLRNSFLVLHLDFSMVEPKESVIDIEKHFDLMCNLKMKTLVAQNNIMLCDKSSIVFTDNSLFNLQLLLHAIESNKDLPRLYVIIDEYDNFANQLITAHKDSLYHELTADDSFLKTFFKTLKYGRKMGTIANVLITGVLPITIDDMASGYNIANFLTLDLEFEAMLGFTSTEVTQLLDEIYRDYKIDPATRTLVEALIKNHYNGYHFVNPEGEALYNSTLVMYFLKHLCRYKTIPARLNDQNLKTELSWVRRLTASNPQNIEEFVDQLSLYNNTPYDNVFLVEKFNMFQFFEKRFFPVSFFYLGMLTLRDYFYLKLPNLNMQQIFLEYFNEIHQVDVSTRYAPIMQRFVNAPNLEFLFAGYWEHYVLQLPEAIFQQVNENFYRTTFYELCSRYLSHWFVWHVERSYPQGKSDLEFVGKYNEKFAGLRWVIEFKYYSNTKFKELKTSIEKFKLIETDTQQIKGYVEGLKKEYPEAKISQFVIYCFGNQGFKVFEVSSEL
ncbi:AAA family ATPase [Candidatus Parabeggiatoa sp. HSG14]|uniref:AAA family ATPase n=1 Tax=Candidatus Parabeggiatoa sp. HSG14 TaxID=3055593 RepID=UPI0025A75DB5|nr:AAA family ATPase [Thiotrichales bacterium HSG14]